MCHCVSDRRARGQPGALWNALSVAVDVDGFDVVRAGPPRDAEPGERCRRRTVGHLDAGGFEAVEDEPIPSHQTSVP